MAGEELNVEALKQAMLQATQTVQNFTTNIGQTNQQYAAILTQIKDLNTNFAKEFESAADYLRKVVSMAAGKGGGGKALKVRDSLTHQALNKLVKCLCKNADDDAEFTKKFEERLEEWDSISKSFENVVADLEETIKEEAKENRKKES